MLKPSTFKFLASIAKNNNREWFAENKEKYEDAKADVTAFIEKLIPEVTATDPAVPSTLQAKKCLLRIYRDVRFRKNKDPYKKNFGIWFAAYGTATSGPGYYLHLEPGKSFFGSGWWMPDNNNLKLIRQEIDYNGQEFEEIVTAPDFEKHMTFSSSEILKNAPKGYEPDHEHIGYLKLKSFEVTRDLKDEEFFDASIVNKLKSSFEIVFPFVAFLRNAVAS